MQLGDEHPFRFLIHDRDTKFSHAFDEILRTEGTKVIRTPVQAPNANAFAERWVRTVRADRALRLVPPDGRPGGRDPTPLTAPAGLRGRDLLGGLIHEYDAA